MAKVEIKNIEEARAAGKKYGVAFPEGRGRPPMLKLTNAILAAGDEISPTDYFSGEIQPRVPAMPAGTAEYELKRTEMVEYKGKNGKNGKRPKVTKVRLNVETIRKLTNGTGLRGRISDSSAREAFAKHLKVDATELDGASIVRVPSPAIDPRPIKAEAKPKASKPAGKGEDTGNAKDLVSVDSSDVSKDAA